MAFVNEFVSAVDFQGYGIKEVDAKIARYGGAESRQWTIDRDRNIYLRLVATGREELSHVTTWAFFWGGGLFQVTVEFLEIFKDDSGSTTGARQKIVEIFPLDLIASDGLANKKQEMQKDLIEAFEEYRDGGVYSITSKFNLILEFEGDF